MKVLVSAEAFGFGPSAAAITLATHLRQMGCEPYYVGSAHTLELARLGPFSSVEEVSQAALDEAECALVAMDQPVASALLERGARVVFYDALAWYWPTPAPVLGGAHWVCQDFVGVGGALAAALEKGATGKVVTPLTSARRSLLHSRPVVNLGGVANPMLSPLQVRRYAATVSRAASEACRMLGLEAPLVLSSPAAVEAARDAGVEAHTLTPAQTSSLCSGAPVCMVTPGLANLYDAAAGAARVVWLPPTNDSQALQLELVTSRGLVDSVLGWEAATGQGLALERSQPEVLEQISRLVSELDSAHLARLLCGELEQLTSTPRTTLRLPSLTRRYGADNGLAAAREAMEFLGQSSSAS